MSVRGWKSVESEEEKKWLTVEKSILEEGNQDPGLCPSCHSNQLRYYFVSGSKKDATSRGSFWIWCPHCLRFDHLTCLVPVWWQNKAKVPLASLEPEPNWLEDNWEVLSPNKK